MKTMRLTACGALVAAIGILFGCGTSGTSSEDGAVASASAPLISLDDARGAIEDACPGPFKNHGKCVSCVADKVNDLKGQGDITGQMGGQLVSEFAQGYCKNACVPITCCEPGQCGKIPDGCGGEVKCDYCPSGKTCNETTHKCESACVPKTYCEPGQCGKISDGCGGELECGYCPSGKTCSYNVCVCDPEPVGTTCGSKSCGYATNNCGEKVSCGTCPWGQTCSTEGVCCASDPTPH